MKWQPWIDYKQDVEPLPIGGPPCSSCEHWKPVRKYYENGIFCGVTLCHREQMQDFSCYSERHATSTDTTAGES